MLSRKAVTVRHTLLAAGGVLVLGMAIYLVREVSRTPAPAQADRTSPAVAPAVAATEPAPAEPTRSARIPTRQVRITNPEPAPAGEDPATPALDTPPPALARIAPTGPNPKLDSIMDEANRAYDHGDFDEAKQIAQKVLEKSPGNVRMLRILVSAECIAGDAAEAQKYFNQLPPPDRAQMRTRCDRYGVTFKDP